jgi:hypothetical protein
VAQDQTVITHCRTIVCLHDADQQYYNVALASMFLLGKEWLPDVHRVEGPANG